jgi:hypothetical protein
MSDYEHIKGKLKPTNKTVETYVADDTIPSYYDSPQEYFNDEYYRKAYVIDGMVYAIESEELDPSDSIFRASKNNDGSIDFELRYYNGGCCMNEALENALENL